VSDAFLGDRTVKRIVRLSGVDGEDEVRYSSMSRQHVPRPSPLRRSSS
jgi:hypothetical protein